VNTLIVGAGGVGGYIAASLYRSGRKPTLLLRGQTAKKIRQDGLSLTSPKGNWHGQVDVIETASLEDIDAVDLVVITCKAYDLKGVLTDVAPIVGKETAILPFLNGVGHVDVIGKMFNADLVWGGVAHIAATTDGPGRIIHMNQLHTFRFGPLNGTRDTRAKELSNALVKSGVDAHLSETIQQDMWDKFVFLSALASATCVFRANVGSIVRDSTGIAWTKAVLSECEAVARAEGFVPDPDAMSEYHSQLTDAKSTITSSMLRDIRAGKTTEGGHVVGDMLARAQRHNIPAPHLSLAASTLRIHKDMVGAFQ